MRITTLLTASLIAVLALATTAEARSNSCQRPKLLTAYSANYHAVAKLHGKRAPGRNIRRFGLTHGRMAGCHHIRKSLLTLRRMRYGGSRLLTPSRPYIPPAHTATLRTTSAPLSSIRSCESGGDYGTNTGNGFYGAYQFTQSTWHSVGGTGNPAAASPAEQDKRAAILYSREGASPWPVCGR
jgi:hypothetical protein